MLGQGTVTHVQRVGECNILIHHYCPCLQRKWRVLDEWLFNRRCPWAAQSGCILKTSLAARRIHKRSLRENGGLESFSSVCASLSSAASFSLLYLVLSAVSSWSFLPHCPLWKGSDCLNVAGCYSADVSLSARSGLKPTEAYFNSSWLNILISVHFWCYILPPLCTVCTTEVVTCRRRPLMICLAIW